jgi:hypothetical protein
MGRVPERVARGLVDRHGSRPGGRIRYGTSVDLAGFESPVGHGGGLPCPGPQARLADADWALTANTSNLDGFSQLRRGDEAAG